MFVEKLIKGIEDKNSVLVVGLDPNIEYFPGFLVEGCKSNEDYAHAIYEFNKIVIDQVKDHCAIIKPQLAYYEVFGSAGIKALEDTVQYAKDNHLLVLHDAKRGDIGPTCKAYAEAFLGEGSLAGDSVTVNPYLGRDGIIPFINKANEMNKGLFVLVKTSNPSSGDLQDLTVDDTKIYEKTALLTNELSKDMPLYKNYNGCGVVVGATYPQMATEIRALLPHSFFLVPGYGAQGGSGEDLIPYFDEQGLGAIVSSSRGITYAYLNQYTKHNVTCEQFKQTLTKAAKEAKEDINKYRF